MPPLPSKIDSTHEEKRAHHLCDEVKGWEAAGFVTTDTLTRQSLHFSQ